MRRAAFCLALAVTIPAALAMPAAAGTMVLGDGPAAACYEAAQQGHASRRAMQRCETALNDMALTGHDRAATLVNQGILYADRGQHEDALRSFDDALRFDPGLAEAYSNRGFSLMAREDYVGALAAFDQALGHHPAEPAKAFFGRAAAHEELGQVRAAYEDYGRAAALAPGWEDPRVELARFQEGSQALADARTRR